MLTSHFLLSLPIAIFQQHYTVKMTATVFVSETEHCAVVWHFTLFVGGPCFPQLCNQYSNSIQAGQSGD